MFPYGEKVGDESMQIIPVASGKGGVGKSLVSANLAIALGKAGKNVVLADLDIGASNLHLSLGQNVAKVGFGSFLNGTSKFEDIIIDTGFRNVRFIAGDSEIPGLTAIQYAKRMSLIRKLQNIQADYLILDLGAGTHLPILDMFLLSPQGILVTAPTVTATLNAYLFIKNAVFRLLYNSFPKKSVGYKFLESLKGKQAEVAQMHIPEIVRNLSKIDYQNTEVFVNYMKMFRPRLIMNMIEDPKSADRAYKIRQSCQEYLNLDLDYLGVIFRDPMQDVALSSRLPITLYKPQSILSQSMFRIADKIIQAKEVSFNNNGSFNNDGFEQMEEDAESDYGAKMSYIEDLVGSGTLTTSDLADLIKTQQYEITQLKNSNNLLKSKLVKASQQGFKV